jgi:hypothetical protein
MSLPQFDVQGSLFESLGAIAPDLFADNNKYKLFAKKMWPVLAGCREQLMECYEADNGRPGVEPVGFGAERHAKGFSINQGLQGLGSDLNIQHYCLP